MHRVAFDWEPGTVAPGAVAVVNVNVDAEPGQPCEAGVLAPAPSMGLPLQCIVSAEGVCTVSLRNEGSAELRLGRAQFFCAVWR